MHLKNLQKETFYCDEKIETHESDMEFDESKSTIYTYRFIRKLNNRS